MIRLANEAEIAQWDDLVLANADGGHIYQSSEWAKVKEYNGWEPIYCIYEATAYIVAFVLLRKPASILGSIYYCPKGPGVFTSYQSNQDSRAHFSEFIYDIKTFLKHYDNQAIVLKVEPELECEDKFEFSKLELIKSSSDLQFKATIFVDLKPSEEAILASFKQKTRYNIGLARRRGVVVESRTMDDAGVDLMYELMAATQSRAKFFLRPKDYFGHYWKALATARMANFLVAMHDNDVLGGVFITRFGAKAYYKDGGSFDTKRNLMAPYLLQWEAMQWSKKQGASVYDMVAVPPRAELNNPSHHHYGLYQFKKGFNETTTEFMGCWDLPINIQKFKIWKSQEQNYLKLYAKMKKNLFW
ncbi:peptidoglycan bridge formation glycyltransferase FemA/FemB family protein [Candidatus Saccharibacteria bacterium]|nr:peptidoglycan bridge formation glycyltransferase FemA/FemB family protein [Candidatus Saccharibacteria bacterium]